MAQLKSTGITGSLEVTTAYITGSITGSDAKFTSLTASSIVGTLVGGVETAERLATSRSISASGDVVWNVSFDGSGDVTGIAAIGSGVIVNDDISATAAISDTKLDTISTAGKVSNSATTATNLNTANAIVSRDANGDFSAGAITATFTGSLQGTAATASYVAWSNVNATPTTLSGYGITDAQPLDNDLTAIAGLSGTSGLLKKTATDTWTLDTNSYITGNEEITISGDVSGTGATSISITSVSASFIKSGTDGSNLTNLTASQLSNFSTDVRSQISAGTGISYVDGEISASNVPNSSLQNNSIEINGVNVSLGGTGSITVGTGDVTAAGNTTFTGDNIFESSLNQFTGSFSGDLAGNSSTAAALQLSRTISASGDIEWGVSFDGSGNVTGVAAIGSGVIVNDDISATASISDTKLDTISTAGKVSNTALPGSGQITIGNTSIALGNSSLALSGLSSVTSSNFVGNLQGTANTASYVDWSNVDNAPSFLTSNETITVSGDAQGTGTTSISLSSISASFIKSATDGSNLTNLSASQISNFINDVRAQFSAGSNITIVNGQISSTAGGDVSAAGDNTFTGTNTFNSNYITGSITGSDAKFTSITGSLQGNSSTATALEDMSISQFTNDSGYITSSTATEITIQENYSQTFFEDFSSFSIGSTVNTADLLAFPNTSGINLTVKARQTDIIGKRYIVYNSVYAGATTPVERYVKYKNAFSGSNRFIVTALKNNNLTVDYDTPGLNLDAPEAGKDLVFQYSFDNVNWINHSNILTGSNTTGTGTTEVTESILLNFTSSYYVRYFQGQHIGGANDNYAITDLTVESLEVSANEQYFTLIPSSSGQVSLYSDDNLTYNASTSTLKASIFSGSLQGNASTVTNGVYTTNISSYATTGVTAGTGLSGGGTTGSLTLSLTSPSIQIGTTEFTLGLTGSTIAGLDSVTSTGFSGSFSGSFIGDGSGIANVPAQAQGEEGSIQFNSGSALQGSSFLKYSFQENVISVDKYVIAETYSTSSYTLPSKVTSIDGIDYNNKVYKFIGFSEVNSNAGRVSYVTSSDGGISWSSLIEPTEMTGSAANSYFGNDVSCLVYGSDLHVFVSQHGTSTVDGNIFQFTTSDGVNWTRTQITSQTANLFFGSSIKAIRDVKTNNLYVFIGEPGTTSIARVHYITSSNGSTWSNPAILASAPTEYAAIYSRFGVKIDAISNNDGIQVFIGAPGMEPPGGISDQGYLYVITSSNGSSWSSLKQLATGSSVSAYLGATFVKAIEYNGGVYCFSGEIGYDISGVTNVGSVFVISSSDGTWPSSGASNYTKKILYTGSTSNDYVGTVNQSISPSSIPYNNEPFDAEIINQKIYWAVGGSLYNKSPLTDVGIVHVGSSEDGIIWKDEKTYYGSSSNEKMGDIVSFTQFGENTSLLFSNLGTTKKLYNATIRSKPIASVEVQGSVKSNALYNTNQKFIVINGDYGSIDVRSGVYILSASANGSLVLPSAIDNVGLNLTFMRIDDNSSATVTLYPSGSETFGISGASKTIAPATSGQYGAAKYISLGQYGWGAI